MADDNDDNTETQGPPADDPRRMKAKDLLRAGELEPERPGSERFGRSFAERRFRRPVGNSERLWKKVDGEDPWEANKARKPEKKQQRGVYAAGRFVRVDKHRESKERAKKAQIPEWARKERSSGAESGSKQPQQAEVKATPTAEDPMARLMQIIAQKNAEAQAKIDKASDAASRMKKKAPPAPVPTPGAPPRAPSQASAHGDGQPVPTPPRPPKPAPRKSSSRSGRMRTSSGRRTAAPAPPPVSPSPQKPRQMAAGRAPPKPRGKPTDLPVEMRRPPRIDPNARTAEAVDPKNRRMAAGRAPPKPRAKPKDIPLEMRRPPRIGADGVVQKVGPATEIRKDSPAFNRPGKKTVSKKARPSASASASSPKAPAKTAEPAAPPIDRTPPKPRSVPKPKPPGGGAGGNAGGMDDIFGMAAQGEGPMRIGRRKKKKAAAEPDKSAKPKPDSGPPKPPFPIPKVPHTPQGKKED